MYFKLAELDALLNFCIPVLQKKEREREREREREGQRDKIEGRKREKRGVFCMWL